MKSCCCPQSLSFHSLEILERTTFWHSDRLSAEKKCEQSVSSPQICISLLMVCTGIGHTIVAMADPKAPDLLTLRSEEYTIGLVTALSEERAAVEVMLDEEHSEPAHYSKTHTDHNSYSWGRIGKHNVVLASLPNQAVGKVEANTVAMSMITIFPSIRVGLMIGVGGGVPSQDYDIRLGDIVVSIPFERAPGVVQYDLGREELINGQRRFVERGILNKPPRSLLNAISALRAEHMRRGESRVNSIIADVFRQRPRMKKKKTRFGLAFSDQGAENDVLFPATYPHASPNSDCSSCGREELVWRDPREDDGPFIHYGIIASGDRVIKDAQVRDQIANRIKDNTGGDCLCFEMEAAGLMDGFPCLVIRGVSDYSDTHKNWRWQGYASMTAAAFAKGLLSKVNIQEVYSADKAGEVVER